LNNGAQALGSGKTYHPKLPPAYDGNRSWSALGLPYKNPCWNSADNGDAKFQDGGLPCIPCPVDIRGYLFKDNVSIANEFCAIDADEDALTVDKAIAYLRDLSKAPARPFYLAVGMHKPHLPWQASEEDFAKHPLDSVSLPANRYPPKGMPPLAFHYTDEKIPGHDSPWAPVAVNLTRGARRAYRASVTGMDRKLGRLFAELDALKLADTTAVIFHGDHGWQLGEHGEWRKMTNFEIAVRVPFMISVPWLNTSGTKSAALVELIDVLPTAAALAGLSLPSSETFDGMSLVPLLDGSAQQLKDAAFSQYPRRVKDEQKAWSGNSVIHSNRSTFTHMGYSVRSARWRYTEWLAWNGSTLRPVWDDVVARELYDHGSEPLYPVDFDSFENINEVNSTAYAGVIANLSWRIRQRFAN